MDLYIDTTDFNKVAFGLAKSHPGLRSGIQKNGFRTKSGMTHQKSYKIDPQKSHETLAKLDEFLKNSKIRNPQSEIHKIICNKGPGSYTGVRVGVTIAQALGFAWGVRVKFLDKDQFSRRYTEKH